LYIDNILGRIKLQIEAYGKESNIPQRLFDILKKQKQELEALKEKYGSIVSPKQLEEG
jgi:phosphoenolpyruvate carboxykinase (GTP)